MRINGNYKNVEEGYLFSTIARKVKEYSEGHPKAKLIRMGIGDVTQPLCKAVVEAMQEAAGEQGDKKSFHGYGPEQGYGFLKEAIRTYYAGHGVELEEDEIFVSDGAKSDIGNILDLFAKENHVLIPNPVYPVYLDTNTMDGRKILFMDANESNGFLPMPDDSVAADLIYLCSPNNPTGAVYRREQLKRWVEYAEKQGAVILFDAAYEAFVFDHNLPRSIFEIDGAKECAVEFCSFSKTAGFTGTRCGYTVIPKTLKREGMSLNKMWLRRQTTKFNGVSYIVQRGAAAALTGAGEEQIASAIKYYRNNAATIMQRLDELGIWYTGGVNSPYIWMKVPGTMTSWEYFDYLLQEKNIVGTPGAGFGKNGEGFFRLTAFGDDELTREAMARM